MTKVVNSVSLKKSKKYLDDRCRCQNATVGSASLIKGVALVLNPDYESILNSIDSVSLVFNVLLKLRVESHSHTHNIKREVENQP